MNEEMRNTEYVDDEISLKEIFTYICKRKGKILFRGFVSLAVVVLVFACFYAFAPKTNTYGREIMLTLPKNTAGTVVYPGGTVFSEADLVSPAVLKAVYEANKLQDRMSLAEFSALFHVSNVDMSRSFLDARYQSLMSKKNISAAELDRLQKEYNQKLKRLRADKLGIRMNSSAKFNQAEVLKIMNEIPAAWFEIYSKSTVIEEDETAPAENNILSGVQTQLKGIQQNTGDRLIPLEKARFCIVKLLEECDKLEDIYKMQNADMKEIRTQLKDIETYQIDVLRQLVLSAPEKLSKIDKAFIDSRVDSAEKQVLMLSRNYDSVIDTLEAYRYRMRKASIEAVRVRQDSTKELPTVKATATVSQLLQKGGHVSQFAYTDDIMDAGLLTSYIAKYLTDCTEKRAAMEAELAYFKQIQAYAKAPAKAETAISDAEFGAKLKAVYDNLQVVCADLKKKHSQELKNLTAGAFYTASGGTVMQSSYRFAPKKVLLGLAALFFLFNGIWVVAEFISMRSKKLLEA